MRAFVSGRGPHSLAKEEEMGYEDLKGFLALLESKGQLVRVKEELNPRHEVAAVLKELDREDGPAVIFENVSGYKIPVVGNVLGTRDRLALAFGISKEGLKEEFLKRKNSPLSPQVRGRNSGRDIVIRDQIDLLKVLPVLTYHEKDAGPYITGGVVFLKDRVTGMRSMGIHRIQIKDRNRMCVSLLAGTARKILDNAAKRGEYLDVAIAIGLHPLTLLSAAIWTAGDKLGIAGGLKGEPLELTRCETVELEVPAEAEIIIEGRIPPGVKDTDGPFGEGTGYYLTYQSPVVEVTAITMRENPIYSVVLPGSLEEHNILSGLTWRLQVLEDIKALAPSVVDLTFVPGTLLSHVVISMKKTNEGEPKRVGLLALMMYPYIKNAIVVDDDVNVDDLREVEWAISTRCQGDRDVIVVHGLAGSPLDPSIRDGLTAKVCIDATKPLSEATKFEKVKVPEESLKKAREILKKLN